MKQIGLRSYQDIITPEEKERRELKRLEREERKRELAEYLAEVAKENRKETSLKRR